LIHGFIKKPFQLNNIDVKTVYKEFSTLHEYTQLHKVL